MFNYFKTQNAPKEIEIFFLDRQNYNSLQDKKHNVFDVIDKLSNNDPCKVISVLTKEYTSYLNYYINLVILDRSIPTSGGYNENNLSNKDIEYIKNTVNSYLNEEVCINDISDIPQFYEFVPQPDGQTSRLLIVVEEGFLNNLTKSKEELSKFFLTCLSSQFKNNSNYMWLMKKYIELKTIDGFFDLVKLRLN